MLSAISKHFPELECQININVKEEACLNVFLLPNYVNMYYWLPFFPSWLLAPPILEKVCFIQENKTGRGLRVGE